jgi:hypothetical protein
MALAGLVLVSLTWLGMLVLPLLAPGQFTGLYSRVQVSSWSSAARTCFATASIEVRLSVTSGDAPASRASAAVRIFGVPDRGDLG